MGRGRLNHIFLFISPLQGIIYPIAHSRTAWIPFPRGCDLFINFHLKAIVALTRRQAKGDGEQEKSIICICIPKAHK